MTESVMARYMDAYVRFKENYSLRDWWYVLIPSLLLSFVGELLGTTLLSIVPFVILLALTGYNVKLQIKLYQDKKAPDLQEELKGTQYSRDGIAGFLSSLPFLIATFVYTVLCVVSLIFVAESNISYSMLVVAVFASIVGWLVTTYYTHLPFTLVPYILATNEDITALGAVKLSYVTLSKDKESMWQIVHAIILTVVFVFVSAFLLFIPLIFVIPYLNFYTTDVYMKILEKHKLIESTESTNQDEPVNQDESSNQDESDKPNGEVGVEGPIER